jgi:hypothetical protein
MKLIVKIFGKGKGTGETKKGEKRWHFEVTGSLFNERTGGASEGI